MFFFRKSKCTSGDCENGYGVYEWNNGSKYVGEWKDGLIHGQGTYTWANGDKYVGEWKDDERHGHGTATFATSDVTDRYSGQVRKGIWKNGQFVEEH